MKRLLLTIPFFFSTALAANYTDTLREGYSFSESKYFDQDLSPFFIQSNSATLEYDSPYSYLNTFTDNDGNSARVKLYGGSGSQDYYSDTIGFAAPSSSQLVADTLDIIWNTSAQNEGEVSFDLYSSDTGSSWILFYSNDETRNLETTTYSFTEQKARFFKITFRKRWNNNSIFDGYGGASAMELFNLRFYRDSIYGCTNPNSINFSDSANVDDGTCSPCNSQNLQNCSETGCEIEDGFWDTSQNLCRANTLGCTDPAAENFDENATVSDPSACVYCTAENPENCSTAESCTSVGSVWYPESNLCGTDFEDPSSDKNLPDTENSVFIDDPVSAGYHQTFQLKCERYNENFDCDNWRFDISEEFLTFGIDSIYKILLYFFGFVLLFGFSVWILRGIYKITFN